MTVQEIAQYVCETVGDMSSDAQDYAKRAIRLKYQTLYDYHAWRESQRTLDNLTLNPDLNGSLFLPCDAEEVIFLAISYDGVNYARLRYRERDWIERASGPNYTLPGNTPWFYRAENLAWPYFNPGQFTFTTLDPASFNIAIEGKDLNGFPVSENLILNATENPDGSLIAGTAVTVNSYSVATSLSVIDTTKTLSISTTVVGQPVNIPADLNELVFTQMVVYPTPVMVNADGTPRPVFVRVHVKLKPDLLANDMSVPRISHIWDALIEFALSSMYTRGRQLGKAAQREDFAVKHLQSAVNLEKNQTEFSQQVVPTVYELGDYLLEERYRPSSSNPFGW